MKVHAVPDRFASLKRACIVVFDGLEKPMVWLTLVCISVLFWSIVIHGLVDALHRLGIF